MGCSPLDLKESDKTEGLHFHLLLLLFLCLEPVFAFIKKKLKEVTSEDYDITIIKLSNPDLFLVISLVFYLSSEYIAKICAKCI